MLLRVSNTSNSLSNQIVDFVVRIKKINLSATRPPTYKLMKIKIKNLLFLCKPPGEVVKCVDNSLSNQTEPEIDKSF